MTELKKYKYHKLSNFYELMEGAEFNALVDDIKRNLNIQFPLTIKKGEFKSLLGDYQKDIEILEIDKKRLKAKLINIEQRIINTLQAESEKVLDDDDCKGDGESDGD